ncbi:hypothetical protein K9B33_12945 [Sphingobium sp. 3R8]|uniref:sensor histidine kinase n=1 Tax=Sphingobium sp. 3R8 TaxID=2874921 RepID=UPI001CCED3B7|nr:histidine kinase dimerization/phospho-acceptor domain-containing protein [Sphingobium sp. 3R8]MBZ9648454.1 hypothetical protein [Sphingobium sp. 3R8]
MLDIVARQAADILERTIAEEQLRQLAETLEVRVEERSRELMASEDQVRQLQKMEAIGQLTGGVAHDFNNLLTIIRSSAELLARRELPRDKQKKYIDAIAETADRAAKLTSQLLAFARRQALKPEIFNAADKVASVADMLRTVVESRIALTVDPICSSCFVEVDASQFETALVNMAINARDAMSSEGSITIAIEAEGCIPARRGHAAAKGDFVKLCVTDTGSGMAGDQLYHIFEPFFTTKEVGKGIVTCWPMMRGTGSLCCTNPIPSTNCPGSCGMPAGQIAAECQEQAKSAPEAVADGTLTIYELPDSPLIDPETPRKYCRFSKQRYTVCEVLLSILHAPLSCEGNDVRESGPSAPGK